MMNQFIEKILTRSSRDRDVGPLILFIVLECYKKYFPIDSNVKQDNFQTEIDGYLQMFQKKALLDTYTINLVDFDLFINIGHSFPYDMKHFRFSYDSIEKIYEASNLLCKEFDCMQVLES